MATDRKKNVFKYIGVALFLLVTLVMVWMTNHHIPFMMDDLWYSTKLSTDEPLKSFTDIFYAQMWHYNNWGGRTMAHSLLQMILMCGEKVADILNTCMVLLTAVILVQMSENISGIKRKLSDKIFVVALLMGVMHGVNADWKMSMYWQSGAANYLFITFFIILYLWCFVRELSATDIKSAKTLPGIYFWIIPLGIISGWSNENMGPVAFIFSVATLIYVYRKCQKVKVWMIEGAVCSLAGSVLCILAPGNFVRNAEIEANSYGILWQAYLHAYSDFNGLFRYLFLIAIAVVFLLIVSICILNEKPGIAEIFLIVAAILSWGAMIISPHYPDRASYGTMILLVLVGLTTVQRIVVKKPEALMGMYACGGLIWCRGMFFLAEYLGYCWGWIK